MATPAPVIPLGTDIARALADLAAEGAPCALVGGLAVSAWVDPRTTRDIDLAVAVRDDRHAEQLVRSLCARGYRLRALIEQDAVGRLSAARLVREEGAVVIDLLFASSGVEPELVAAAEHVEILPGLMVPLATVGHLMALKLLARDDRSRPQDADDLRRLLAVASDAEMARCVEALSLITARGFHRGRDLGAAWRALLEDEAHRV
jgi:predicted nucleotidyltransferase